MDLPTFLPKRKKEKVRKAYGGFERRRRKRTRTREEWAMRVKYTSARNTLPLRAISHKQQKIKNRAQCREKNNVTFKGGKKKSERKGKVVGLSRRR